MINKQLQAGLAWAGGLLVLAFAAATARKLGYVDGDAAARLVAGVSGLMIAWFGNLAPKRFTPSACARQAARVGGWSMVLSGLVYAAVWAFAPIAEAMAIGCGVVLAGIAVTVGYCVSLRARAKAV